MAGVTEAQASVMRRRRSCNVGGEVAYTCPFMCPHKVFSAFARVSRRHSVENHNQINVPFLHSVFSINVRKASFRTKSRVLYNFLIDKFLVSFTVCEIGQLIPQFANRWRCKLSHQEAHNSLFTIPRHQLYGLSCHRLEVKGGATDISGNPVLNVTNVNFKNILFISLFQNNAEQFINIWLAPRWLRTRPWPGLALWKIWPCVYYESVMESDFKTVRTSEFEAERLPPRHNI
ncbi:hypothetical protein AVEN_163257-1 [Araneus ventricosus]|uniref:Uncharacterized protein n=1 Tax=Araneus ventricosus TaxID=182803 RepID=A0A4Y1ZMB2_ARAVE|nr:hypothetical protein AVEN_80210-1 [Araneus ventricosus]GBL58443.1 hypothetical protein AVEN_163257-1 [Araneus ventricosus]